ncbi:MAG TPA: DUF3300 domain-containing protein [Stellaceae bacterium]|nr:DUF3300 domain-containing protein [Stellaceae bacterium]
MAQPLSAAKLDQLVAPVALYPDPLLSQVLMASTYPLEVVEAARWTRVQTSRALSREALVEALKDKAWDPSVLSLVSFPRLLSLMVDKLEWTEQLGDAFLAQQDEVLDAVQRLRQRALTTGNLRVTPQCHCVVRTSDETVSILPAGARVIGVPIYDPAVAYGSWPDPLYPPIAFPPPTGFAAAAGAAVGFESAVDLTAFGPLWGWSSIDWSHHSLAVDPARYALAGKDHPALADGIWVHNPAHRGAVGYADAAVTARFDAARIAAITRVGRAATTHPRVEAHSRGAAHSRAAGSHVWTRRHARAFAPGTVIMPPPGYRRPPRQGPFSSPEFFADGPPPGYGAPFPYGRYY